MEIGCSFLTLAQHSADDIWGRLEKCKVALVRDFGGLGLTAFDFARDVAKIKVPVSGVPLAPTGQGSIW